MPKIRSVALYARLSVTTDESVSIARQLTSARAYTKSRGWKVALEAVDDGVSASKTLPEDRDGWRQIMDSPANFQAVVIWKVDRLARRTRDFLNTNHALESRGAAIVAVDDPVDMTTAQGRAFAAMLAVFAELESESTSARVAAARRQLVQSGRLPGGRPPYGFKKVNNPHGPGFVVAHDPERIDFLRDVVRRLSAGDSTYSVAQYLTAARAPMRENKSRAKDSRGWAASSVTAMVKSPLLAGMFPYTPGRKASGRGSMDEGDVLRGDDGLPVTDETLAIMTPAEWRQMRATIAARALPGERLRPGSDMVLFGIAKCALCGRNLHRQSKADRMGCSSTHCSRRPTIDQAAFEGYVLIQVRERYGSLPAYESVAVGGDTSKLDEVEAAVKSTLHLLEVGDGSSDQALYERLSDLKAMRNRLKESTPAPRVETLPLGRTFAEVLAGADLDDKRSVLRSILEEVRLSPALKPGRGQNLDDRVEIVWRGDGDWLAGQTD